MKPHSNPLLQRRHLVLGLPLLGLPLAGSSIAGLLPEMGDLEPRWNQIKVGMAPEQAISVMGQPIARQQAEWLGLPVAEYSWRDVLSSYHARFVGNALYAKSMTRHSLFGLGSGNSRSQS